MKIKSINAYEIIASGGYPSIECRVELADGSVGIASVPYGASAGSHEATVLLDGDKSRFNGKGMLKAVQNINEIIAPKLVGLEADNQKNIDQIMIDLDGTENKSNLGGNSILAVSLAVARAQSASKKVDLFEHIIETFEIKNDLKELPSPMVVVIEGGKHAHNSTDLQEFCMSAVSNHSKFDQLRSILESYHALKKVLEENKLSTNVGNEGAFAPEGIDSNEAPFSFMMEAIGRAGYVPGKDISFSIDAAASEFYKSGKYILNLEEKTLNSNELIKVYSGWLDKYPIVSLEDGLNEDDWDNWVELNKICKERGVLNIGDDLTVTNQQRLQKAIDINAINSILIKLNQIGSLTETVETCLLAKKHGFATIPSHRGGGETNDTSMIDLAVAVGSKFIKVGPTRGERVAKYNRLFEIERKLGLN
ncbi:MAG: enolase [Candidatus Dojkabacteria bacterium]|nr:MAG: enolase [Candidatus Dojkabacteria bacterium]